MNLSNIAILYRFIIYLITTYFIHRIDVQNRSGNISLHMSVQIQSSRIDRVIFGNIIDFFQKFLCTLLFFLITFCVLFFSSFFHYKNCCILPRCYLRISYYIFFHNSVTTGYRLFPYYCSRSLCLYRKCSVPCNSSHYQRCHQNLYDFFLHIFAKSAHLISPLYETLYVTPNVLKRFRSSLHLLRLWVS